jgi:hypothetical protein
MAEGGTVEPREVVKVITGRSVDEKISGVIQDQKDVFPSPLDVSIDEGFSDAFKPPGWCDVERFAYCWLDPNDEVGIDEAMEQKHWLIVTRSNHPKGKNSDFRAHGAVERRGLILAYRPRDLDSVMRYLPTKKHLDIMGSKLQGQKGPQHELTLSVGDEKESGKFTPFVAEEAGHPVAKASEMINLKT